ncbi:MAG: Lrp/AsnC family transcriptional regulator [Paracoccaceae bacterium]|nr:Lrp/AsnC family transcriptional regulator [Paracoccaceae bacterium]MDG1738178.1 Lrp/AsnC family transcriptional regulator [Paracoccaceae bacterium]MDG2258988.1 Lrp/AsnC family transcriptional regulator [Paracoccaceae bacterium]
MDDIDRKILMALGENARQSMAILARKLGLARTTVQSRIDRLEMTGVIQGYTVRLGQSERAPIQATVLISYEPQSGPAVLSRLKAIPQVRAARTTSGRYDMLIELAAETTSEMDDILDRICSAKGVKGSESLIHLSNKIDRGAAVQ